MLFLVWKIYLEVYGGNQLINPWLKNTLHHLISGKYPQLLAWASELPGDLAKCVVVNDQSLSSITTIIGADQLDLLLHMTCCKEFLNFIFHPLIILHSNWVWFLGCWVRSACVNGHLCEGSCSY